MRSKAALHIENGSLLIVAVANYWASLGHKDNSGFGSTLNAGIEYAVGEYMGFVDLYGCQYFPEDIVNFSVS